MSNSKTYDFYLASPQWAEKKRQRLELDKNTCQMCGTKDNLNVHHVTYESICNEDVKKDLITLCSNCHTAVHEEAQKIDIDACEFAFYHIDEGRYIFMKDWAEACDNLMDAFYRAPRGVFEEGSWLDCGSPMWCYRRCATSEPWRLMTHWQFSSLLAKGIACYGGQEDKGTLELIAMDLSANQAQWRKAKVEWFEWAGGHMPPANLGRR